MILTEEKLKTKERKDFGIPELKKYPMPDKEHVLAAIRMFNHVDKEHEKELATNIKQKMKKYGIPNFSKFDAFNGVFYYCENEDGTANTSGEYIPKNGEAACEDGCCGCKK